MGPEFARLPRIICRCNSQAVRGAFVLVLETVPHTFPRHHHSHQVPSHRHPCRLWNSGIDSN